MRISDWSSDVCSSDLIRKILVNALGENKAGGLIDRILLGRSSKGLESLKWMESRAIAEMISQEHPQIIALVLAHLDPDQAAEVIGYQIGRASCRERVCQYV